MSYLETDFFMNQLAELSEKYSKVFNDYEDFKKSFNHIFSTSLWNDNYKQRVKNSSIPTWKRWGFRIIVKIIWDKIIPFLIYAKTMKENVTDEEIVDAFEFVLKDINAKRFTLSDTKK